VLAFFLIPNRTLQEYWQDPTAGPAPLFTLSGANPGGFDQVLTFRSDVGRTAEGSSREVVSPGPLVIFAFEDLSAAKQSDQDFTDVVFTVTAVQGRLDALECE
jgi:hypothetical protein